MRLGAWGVLAAASAVAVAVILHLNRDATFFFDEVIWFSDLSARSGVGSILHPHNGHLIGTTRLVYLGTESVFGTHYLVMRILAVATVVACSWLFFAYVKRRVGSLLALIPSVLLLFYGSAWQHVVSPIGFTVLLSIAFGLAAMLALDRGDRRGDVLACAFACAACFTYTVGVMFTVGLAILVLAGSGPGLRERARRAWIFVVPLALYAIWWLWATQFDQGREQASNVSRIVSFFGESAANVSGALSGANGVLDARPNWIGWAIAAVLLLALLARIVRGRVPALVWAGLAIVAAYWLAAALADDNALTGENQAVAVRYVYPASVAILLAAAGAASGIRAGRVMLAAALAVGVFSLVMNVKLLRDGGNLVSSFGRVERVNLAMLELANGGVPGASEGLPATARPELAEDPQFLRATGPDRDDYLASASRYGSPAYPLGEIESRPEDLGPYADSAINQAYGLTLQSGGKPASTGDCEDGATVDLPTGGAYVRLRGAPSATLGLARFGPDPGYPPEGELGTGWSRLAVPTDRSTAPWRATVSDGRLEACPLGG